jgi:phage terminase Nu1 subunit (DNA packaging protein)
MTGTRDRNKELGDLFDAADIARLVGVSKQAVSNWTQKGKLRVWRRTVGNRAIYEERDVNEFVARWKGGEWPEGRPATRR